MKPNSVMKYLGTAIGCTLMLLLTVPRYGGFLLVFFLLASILYFLHSETKSKHESKTKQTKLALWITAIFVALTVNIYRYNSTRNLANDVAAAIHKYHDTNSIYPSSLEALGYSRNSLKSLGWHVYSSEGGRAIFIYGVPYMPFDSYRYKFDSEEWVYSDY